MLELSTYTHGTAGEIAVYKGIPVALLEAAKARIRAENPGCKLRIRYRGQRNHPLDTRYKNQRYQDCIKRFANTFSVYID
jgi:hypothetical protein